MSAFTPLVGDKRTSTGVDTHKSAFCKRGSINVRFALKATEVLRCRELTRCATNGHDTLTAVARRDAQHAFSASQPLMSKPSAIRPA
jgi:hypothetical protein